jgi:hypothetical protein
MGHRYLQGYVFSRPLEAELVADGAWEAYVDVPAAIPTPRSGAEPVPSLTMPS